MQLTLARRLISERSCRMCVIYILGPLYHTSPHIKFCYTEICNSKMRFKIYEINLDDIGYSGSLNRCAVRG